MEAGRNEGKDVESIRSLTQLPHPVIPALEGLAGQKLTLLKELSANFEQAIREIKEGKEQEILTVLAKQDELMKSVDSIDLQYGSKLVKLPDNQRSVIAEAAGAEDTSQDDNFSPLKTLLHLQKAELSRAAEAHRQLTVLVGNSMQDAKEALVRIKKQKEMEGILQRMENQYSGILMDRKIK